MIILAFQQLGCSPRARPPRSSHASILKRHIRAGGGSDDEKAANASRSSLLYDNVQFGCQVMLQFRGLNVIIPISWMLGCELTSASRLASQIEGNASMIKTRSYMGVSPAPAQGSVFRLFLDGWQNVRHTRMDTTIFCRVSYAGGIFDSLESRDPICSSSPWQHALQANTRLSGGHVMEFRVACLRLKIS